MVGLDKEAVVLCAACLGEYNAHPAARRGTQGLFCTKHLGFDPCAVGVEGPQALSDDTKGLSLPSRERCVVPRAWECGDEPRRHCTIRGHSASLSLLLSARMSMHTRPQHALYYRGSRAAPCQSAAGLDAKGFVYLCLPSASHQKTSPPFSFTPLHRSVHTPAKSTFGPCHTSSVKYLARSSAQRSHC